jgi:HSP20 family protein
MDLHENSDKNSVTATFEFPGLKKEDVTIDVHNGRLTVSGESKMSEEHEESGYAVRERKYGKFSRTLQLPQGVKVSTSWMQTSAGPDDDRRRTRSKPEWRMVSCP